MDSRFHNVEKGLKLAAPAASLILVAAIGWSAAPLIWALWPAPEDLPTLPPPRASTQSANGGSLNINALISAHMFGKAEVAQVVEQKPVDAPETRLNLTLKGIFNYGDDPRSRAIIADNSRVERPYAVGDQIAGGAVLDSIEADRVILKRSGRYETLRLERNLSGSSNIATSRRARSPPKPAVGGRNIQRRSGSAGTSSTGSRAAASLAAIRTEILNDPSKIQEYVRIQPVQTPGGDGVRGYRIYPGNNRNAFRNAGLRAGEVVTSVNGVQLNDPAVALQLLGDVSQATEVTLTLERGGQTRNVTLDLSQ